MLPCFRDLECEESGRVEMLCNCSICSISSKGIQSFTVSLLGFCFVKSRHFFTVAILPQNSRANVLPPTLVKVLFLGKRDPVLLLAVGNRKGPAPN